MLKIKIKLSKRGFSLVEIMVAVAILAMAIFGIFLAYSTGFMGMADARDRTVATNIAREKMEEIKDKPFFESITYPSENISGKEFTTTVNVTPMETNLSNITTTVTWYDRKGNQKEVKLEMLVYALQTTASSLEIGSIDISAEPTEVTCCIGETSTITARVYDTSENLVPDGTIVSFSTTSISASLSSDFAPTFEGTATVTLTLGDEATIVTAFIGAVSDTVDITCTVPYISVIAVPTALAACETSTITATLTETDALINPIADQVVEFSTDKGALSNDIATTNSSGEAIVTLTSGYEGIATVVASFCGETSNTIPPINFTTPIIIVDADPAVIVLDTDIKTSTISAKVTDSSNNPVINQIVEFTTDDGKLDGGTNTASATTNEDGIATVVLSDTAVGKATVQASYCSVTGEFEVITKQYSGGNYIIVSADPKEIIADGTSPSTITATMYDKDDDILTEYAKDITFDTTLGTFSNDSNPITLTITSLDYNSGIATVDLTSSTTSGIATITVSSDGLTPGSTTVTFSSSNPDHIKVLAYPILVNGGTCNINAIIKNCLGDTVTDYSGTVHFEIIEGAMYAGWLLESDDPVPVFNGEAVRVLQSKSEGPGTVKVEASSTFDSTTISGFTYVSICNVLIELPLDPEMIMIDCHPYNDILCSEVQFNIDVKGIGLVSDIHIDQMKVTWLSGLSVPGEKLNEIKANRSGWENPAAWTGNACAGETVSINKPLPEGLHIFTLFFNTNMSGKTIEVIFYTDKGDFLLELEIVVTE